MTVADRFYFSKRLRLLKPAEYRDVFKKGMRFHEKTVSFIALPNSLDIPRLGLAIAKKNVRLAVERNRIKRIIRESFRFHQVALKGFDIVVIARVGMANNNNKILRELSDKNWARIKSCKQF